MTTKFDISKPPVTVWRCDSLRRPWPVPATITPGGFWAVLTNGDRKALGKTVCLTEAEAYAIWVRRLSKVANNSYLRNFQPQLAKEVATTLMSIGEADKIIQKAMKK